MAHSSQNSGLRGDHCFVNRELLRSAFDFEVGEFAKKEGPKNGELMHLRESRILTS